MKIYTRGGDKGETGLIGGRRTGKDDPRLRAYGAVDELGAVLGQARAWDETGEFSDVLMDIQKRLLIIGSHLASPDPRHESLPALPGGAVTDLETLIDEMDEELKPLKHFLVCGGTPLGATLHLARTVCRRSERDVVALTRGAEIAESIVIYLNRLSDFLFNAARLANQRAGREEEPWLP